MKKLTMVWLFFLTISPAFSQPGTASPTLFLSWLENGESDSLRNSFLPIFDTNQFYISFDDKRIQATLKDSVLTIGMISTPNHSDSFYINHPALKGHWKKYVIEIRLLEKMEEEDKKILKLYNDSLLQRMKDLPDILGIQHCDIGKDMYNGKTQKDRDKVDLYEKEKLRLFNMLVPLPLFSTQYLDVYVEDDKIFEGYSQHPEWKGYYLVPDNANSLRWKIWDEIRKIEKKFGK